MAMIDRESAQSILDAIIKEKSLTADEVIAGLMNVLTRGLGESPNLMPLPTGPQNWEKIERFFDTVIQIAPKSAEPYSAAEVAVLASHSAAEYMLKAEKAKVGDLCIDSEEELEDSRKFWRSIQADYQRMAQLATVGDMAALMKFYSGLDTADRENFGWGATSFDEARWEATRRKYS